MLEHFTWTNDLATVLRVYSFRDQRPGGGDRVSLGVKPVLVKPSDVSNGQREYTIKRSGDAGPGSVF